MALIMLHPAWSTSDEVFHNSTRVDGHALGRSQGHSKAASGVFSILQE
jgi:hypothetical protein